MLSCYLEILKFDRVLGTLNVDQIQDVEGLLISRLCDDLVVGSVSLPVMKLIHIQGSVTRKHDSAH